MKFRRNHLKNNKSQNHTPDSGSVNYCYECGAIRPLSDFRYRDVDSKYRDVPQVVQNSKFVRWMKSQLSSGKKSKNTNVFRYRYRCVPPSKGPCPNGRLSKSPPSNGPPSKSSPSKSLPSNGPPSKSPPSMSPPSNSPKPPLSRQRITTTESKSSVNVVCSKFASSSPKPDSVQSSPSTRVQLPQRQVTEIWADYDESVSRTLAEIPEHKRLKDLSWKTPSSCERSRRIRQIGPRDYIHE